MVDRDGDTVDDAHDNCPDWPGKPSFLGCNGPQLVKISETKLELLDTVQFAKGARIDRKSFKLLDAAALVLKNHRAVKISIQAQADDKAAEARAFAVKAYFVKKGVSADRMTVTTGTSGRIELVIVPATKP
jgi:formylmethanofuran dehydrogenase subunit E